jgi:hypothetical protein
MNMDENKQLPSSFEILLRWARERGIIKAKGKGEAEGNGSA